MKINQQILIGGQALKELGSSRHTDDVDYLIFDPANTDLFIHDQANKIDYINANGHELYRKIWHRDAQTGAASAQSLLEMKAFSFVQHCRNRYFKKVDDAEFDVKFLVRECGVTDITAVREFIATSEYNELIRIIDSTKNR
jgi:hypothetical protein